MKTLKKIITLLIVIFTVNSCVKDGSFNVPNVTIKEPNVTVNSSVSAIKGALQQAFNSNNKLAYTFPVDENNPTYISGYVVSSDATGNFYKTLIIQDEAENPTAGIEVDIDQASLSQSFEIGRKVYIKLDGLSVSYDDGESTISPTNGVPGKYTLGILDGDRVSDIPSTMVKDHILRSATVKPIVPTTVTIANLAEANINTFIKIDNAQFDKSQLGGTFAGDANDDFDGIRDIFECGSEKIIKLQTSTFSSFKSTVLPEGKGAINAVLSKDFYAEFFVAIINTPSDVSFTDSNRCDPVTLDCGTGTVGGSTVVFDENFDGKTNGQLTTAGWTNVNVNGGSRVYDATTFSGNTYMKVSAFGSNESPFEAWLVTPAINLDNTTDEALTFDTLTGYDNGKVLSVFVSTDFTGDVTTATWTQVDATLSSGPSSGYSTNFTASGKVNISCLSGNVFVAFRYKGASDGASTTFEIDNVKVTGN